jgi:hypothetical protein
VVQVQSLAPLNPQSNFRATPPYQCGSDLHTASSGWGAADYPQVVGHEICGVAVRVGSKVTHIKEGDIVGVGAQCDSCNDCRECNKQKENRCTGMVVSLRISNNQNWMHRNLISLFISHREPTVESSRRRALLRTPRVTEATLPTTDLPVTLSSRSPTVSTRPLPRLCSVEV